ncbi:MAG TPA: plastocyanin/azurin family copper-binding protein [Actinomycetota bacterium]|jgi:plastocyanin
MGRARTLCLLTLVAVAGSLLVPASAGAGGGCHTGYGSKTTQARAEGDQVTAFIAECAFEPTVLYVDEGATVSWTNKDFFDHTVTGAASAWGSERILSQRDSITQEFTNEGVFPYFCLIHPGMVGAIVVGDPDPDDVATATASLGDVGGETGAGPDAAAAPASDSRPSSDSTPGSLLLVTIAALAIASVVAVALVRRRRIEHGI